MEEPGILAGLRREHPRIIFTSEAEARMKELVGTDAVMRQFRDIIIAHAATVLNEGTVEHKKIGRRLLQQTRESLRRILYTAAAYRLTGDKAYLERAEKEMLAAAALSDWNPSHFLDVGEMAAGMGFGYDWLYDSLSETTRATIRAALVEKAFEPSFAGSNFFIHAANNWNPVCHGGLTVAALAVAEDEPGLARRVIERAITNVPYAMHQSCDPDGAYVEGGGYWEYGTSFNVVLISALQSALGSDFGLMAHESFLKSAYYRLLSVGPDGGFFNYGDCPFNATHLSPSLHWFAQAYGKPDLAGLTVAMEAPVLKKMAGDPATNPGRLVPLALAWYRCSGNAETNFPLDRFYDGRNPVAFMRSGWDKDALWLGVKGGNNRNQHCHMDAGEFVVVAGGVRWALAFGGDNYTALEVIAAGRNTHLWGPPGRFEFFRYGLRGHSTLIINGAGQEPEDSASPIVARHSSDTWSHAVVDMSKPWRSQAKKVLRGAAMIDRRSILVQDEVTGAAGEILWQMVIPDTVDVQGSRAEIVKDGKTFVVKILSPGKAVFETLPTKPDFEGENPNKDTARLAFRVPPGGETVTIAVHMWLKSGDDPGAPALKPLADWP